MDGIGEPFGLMALQTERVSTLGAPASVVLGEYEVNAGGLQFHRPETLESGLLMYHEYGQVC